MTFFYAKLVIIEVGGWVEMSMDDLIKRAGNTLKDLPNIKHLDETIIKKNYGFEYERNFRQMLMKVVGIVKLEKLEARLNPGKKAKMDAAIKMLKIARNSVAHTYIKNPAGGGISIAGPSVAMTYFQDIYDGLKDIESNMKKLKLISP